MPVDDISKYNLPELAATVVRAPVLFPDVVTVRLLLLRVTAADLSAGFQAATTGGAGSAPGGHPAVKPGGTTLLNNWVAPKLPVSTSVAAPLVKRTNGANAPAGIATPPMPVAGSAAASLFHRPKLRRTHPSLALRSIA